MTMHHTMRAATATARRTRSLSVGSRIMPRRFLIAVTERQHSDHNRASRARTEDQIRRNARRPRRTVDRMSCAQTWRAVNLLLDNRSSARRAAALAGDSSGPGQADEDVEAECAGRDQRDEGGDLVPPGEHEQVGYQQHEH